MQDPGAPNDGFGRNEVWGLAMLVWSNQATFEDAASFALDEIFLTNNSPAPSAPTNAQAGVASPTQVNLDWNDIGVSNVDYEIHRSTIAGFIPDADTLISDTTESRYVDANVPSGGIYYYRIIAVINGVSSAPSVQLQANTGATPSVPTAPSNAAAVGITDGIRVTWQDNSLNEKGFTIRRSADGGATWDPIAEVGTNVTSYDDVDADLEEGASYIYDALASNDGGTSAPSPASNPSTPTPSVSHSATGVTAVPADIAHTVITVSWNGTSPAGWRIEQLAGDGITWFTAGTVGHQDDEWVFESANLLVDIYSFRVVPADNSAPPSCPARCLNTQNTNNPAVVAKRATLVALTTAEALHCDSVYYFHAGVSHVFDQLATALNRVSVEVEPSLIGSGKTAEYHDVTDTLDISTTTPDADDVIHELVHARDDEQDWYIDSFAEAEPAEALAYSVERILAALSTGTLSLNKMESRTFTAASAQQHWASSWQSIQGVIGSAITWDDGLPDSVFGPDPTRPLASGDVDDVFDKFGMRFSASGLLPSYQQLMTSKGLPANTLSSNFSFFLSVAFR